MTVQAPAAPPASIPGLDIDELDLMVRTTNTLWREGIRTLSQLCALTEDDLRDMRQLGAKGIGDIRAALAARGLRLRAPDRPVPPARSR